MKFPKELLERFYRMMVRMRLCEESLVEPILKGEIHAPCHLYSGQEAIAAGVCANLDRTDYVFGTHRSHGHYLAMGCGMPRRIAEIFGSEAGSSRGRGESHPFLLCQGKFRVRHKELSIGKERCERDTFLFDYFTNFIFQSSYSLQPNRPKKLKRPNRPERLNKLNRPERPNKLNRPERLKKPDQP